MRNGPQKKSVPAAMKVTALIVRVVAVIFVCEALIMAAFAMASFELNILNQALLDAVALSVLSAAPLYYFAIRPFLRARKNFVAMTAHALTDSENHLAQVLDAVVDGIITADEQGRIEIFNPAAEKIFGYTAQEVAGQSINILMGGGDSQRHDGYMRNYHQTKEARIIGFGREVVGRRKDGTEFPIDLAISQLEIDGRRVYTAVLRDITVRRGEEMALREAKEQAERANRVKSEFMANMSHELRTPLNAIIGFSEMTKAQTYGPIGDPKYLEYAGDIQNSAQHLLDLINDILDMARIEAGKVELNEDIFDVHDVVVAPLHLVNAGKVELRNTVPRDLPLLCADKRRVKQIVLNLLSNAVKFTPEGGWVEVSAVVDGAQGIELRVTDNGIGMSEDEILRALCPFEQIDTGLNRKYEGTGLGLPLAERLARLNGAELMIESKAGRGTCASIRFSPHRSIPRDDARALDGQAGENAPRGAGTENAQKPH